MVVDEMTPELQRLVNNFWRVETDNHKLSKAYGECWYYEDDNAFNALKIECNGKEDFRISVQMAVGGVVPMSKIKTGIFINDYYLHLVKEKLAEKN